LPPAAHIFAATRDFFVDAADFTPTIHSEAEITPNTSGVLRVHKGVETTLRLTIDIPDTSVQADPVKRLGDLFDAHQPRLYGLARRLCRDPEEARDLVQETFLRAARRPASIPESAQGAEAWLVRILVNLCRDRWRRLKVRREAFPQPVWSMGGPSDPESIASARSAVQQALARLRPRTRAVVVMHEIEGQSKAEIAELLGMSEVTVRWHVATGRSKLHKELSHDG
jgi:RNA polymerase sigma-70 factor (ECF subfamily)